MFGIDIAPAANTASAPAPYRNRYFNTYGNPFFDQAQFFIPRNLKPLFKFGRWVYYAYEIAHAILNKSSAYIVTDLLYNPAPSTIFKEEALHNHIAAWKTVMDEEIGIRKLLRGMVLDWQIYGNSFMLPIAAREFYYRCSGRCGRSFARDSEYLKFKGYNSQTKQIKHQCAKCGTVDLYIDVPRDSAVRYVRCIRLNPENFNIEYNPLNGECTYYYSIPARVKQRIREGDPDYLRDLPPTFVTAANRDGVMKFRKDRLFHFANTGLAEEDMGWGKPPILPVMRAIFHNAVTRKAEEQILMEHIIPLRILYPGSANGISPIENMDMGLWSSQLSQWLQIWKSDHNAIPISTFPVGVSNVGGDARALLATPNLQEYYKMLTINGMGMPREFVEGGLSYSGSSMSLRMVRNGFEDVRIDLRKAIDFTKRYVMRVKGLADVAIDFSSLQLADDVQKTDQMLQLMGQSLASRKTVLSQLGLNYDDEQRRIKLELAGDHEIKKMEAAAAAESQAETSIIAAKAQARAQYEGEKVIRDLQQKERMQQVIDMQLKRRSVMLGMPDPELQGFIQSGGASISDVIYLTNQGRIPVESMLPVEQMVQQLQDQAILQFGINPRTLDGLPPDLAVMISNNVMPPNEVVAAIQSVIAQQQAEAAQAAAEQGQPPPKGGGEGGAPPQGGGGGGGGGAPPQGAAPPHGAAPPAQENPAEKRAQKIAQALAGAKTPADRAMAEAHYRSTDPEAFHLAMKASKGDKKPMPSQLPPRRDGGGAMS